MKAKYAKQIRSGIQLARELGLPKPDTLTLINQNLYTPLAVKAFNVYRRRHYRKFSDF